MYEKNIYLWYNLVIFQGIVKKIITQLQVIAKGEVMIAKF